MPLVVALWLIPSGLVVLVVFSILFGLLLQSKIKEFRQGELWSKTARPTLKSLVGTVATILFLPLIVLVVVILVIKGIYDTLNEFDEISTP